jgi:hypothetical protein
MIKRYFLLLFISIFYSLQMSAQGYFNNWVWSSNQRVTFNTTPPSIPTSGATITSNRAPAMISSPSGVILFYCDGEVIKDAANNIMPNGTLTGASNFPPTYLNAKQSTLIVPDPGNSNRYYVFVSIYYNTSQVNAVAGPALRELRYSIVDMTLNNGMGNVLSNSKNVFVSNDVEGQLTAIKQSGTNNFWIIVHSNSTNSFKSFLLSSTGVSTTPVTTVIGPINSFSDNYSYWGFLKANTQGTKVARINPGCFFGNYNIDSTELYSFNASTGTFSNYQLLTSGGIAGSTSFLWYRPSIEFSKNGNLLYRSRSRYLPAPNGDSMIQYNLANNNAIAYIPVVSTGAGNGMYDMQLAPNGKIYLIGDTLASAFGNYTMSVINQPDVVGVGCNYSYANVVTGPPSSSCFSCPFPNIIPSLMGSAAPSLDSQYATNVLATTATIHARVVWDGNSPITQRGFYYGTSALPLVNQTLVAGTTGPYLANLTGLTPNTLYYYRAFATNANGTTYLYDSTFLTLPLGNTAPLIKNVRNKATCLTDTMRFVVVDNQTSPANVQVSFASSNTSLIPLANISISGADTNKVISFTPVPFQSGTCVITITAVDSNGASASQSFTVSVAAGPAVSITAPKGTVACAGENFLFTCSIPTGASIEWIVNSVASGISTPSYISTQAVNIKVVCTSAAGCKSSSNSIQTTLNPKPIVNATANGPTSFCIGSSVTLQAQAVAGYTYQWFDNNMAIAGATAPTLVVTNSGSYSYVAYLQSCTDTSNSILVDALEEPSVLITTNNTTIDCKGQALLQANPSNGYAYQWQMNGFNIPGATNSTYTATIGSYYTVVASNGGCTTTSAPITISVSGAPVTIIQWNGTQLYTPTTFASYQWYVNGVLIPGATQQFYTPTSNGVYYCRVGNANNCFSLSPNYNLLTLSVNNLSAPRLQLYPNPTTGLVSLDNFTDGILYVYNALGQLIIQQTTSPIDLSKQANGIYHIRAYNSAQELIGIGRIVKE